MSPYKYSKRCRKNLFKNTKKENLFCMQINDFPKDLSYLTHEKIVAFYNKKITAGRDMEISTEGQPSVPTDN